MSAPPELQLPRPPRSSPWAVVASVAVHGVLLAVLVLVFERVEPRAGRPMFIALSSPDLPMIRAIPLAPPADAPANPATPDKKPGAGPKAAGDSAHGHPPEVPPATPAAAEPITPWAGTARRAATPPALGSGVLWDRRPVPPSIVSRSHSFLTDSAVKAVINHYLDSLAALPNGGRILPPTWKANIGGQEYGLDGNYVTVAGVKIPAIVLGLIPMPVGGNESEALDNAGWMRQQDYDLAMPRDAAAADQQAEAKAIRKRKAAEEELRRKQREQAPPP